MSFTRTYYADFSEEDRHPTTREPMKGYYVVIKAEDEEAARFALFGLFGDSWRFLYKPGEFSPSSCPKGEYASCDAKPFNVNK